MRISSETAPDENQTRIDSKPRDNSVPDYRSVSRARLRLAGEQCEVTMSNVARICVDEQGREVRFTEREVARYRFIAAVNERRRKNPSNNWVARQAKRVANAADPLRQRQIPKNQRPR